MNENHRRSARAPEEIKTDAGARLIARPLRPVRVVVARVAPRPPQPANVMLRCNKRSVATGGEGTPVLVDFGLAKALVFESGGNGDPAPGLAPAPALLSAGPGSLGCWGRAGRGGPHRAACWLAHIRTRGRLVPIYQAQSS